MMIAEKFLWLRRWMRPSKSRFFTKLEICDLRERLEQKQQDLNYLKFQLAKARAEKLESEPQPAVLRDTIASVLNEPVEQLRSAARFQVQKAEAGPEWEVVTDHCCLGGCDLNVCTFPTERDALLFARLLDAAGYQPPHNVACPACYEEHMKDCV